jgi:hypothetical protein
MDIAFCLFSLPSFPLSFRRPFNSSSLTWKSPDDLTLGGKECLVTNFEDLISVVESEVNKMNVIYLLAMENLKKNIYLQECRGLYQNLFDVLEFEVKRAGKMRGSRDFIAQVNGEFCFCMYIVLLYTLPYATFGLSYECAYVRL